VNKTLLAIAAGAMILASTASLAAPTVYGRFNIGLDNQDDEIGLDFKNDDSSWELRDNNNSSRVGVKGKEELGMGGLSVIYQAEFGIDPFGDDDETFSQRNIFVGLEGGFGQIKAGKYDTLVKDIGGKVDQFNDNVGDITRLMRGESRESNLITYTTPKFGGGFKLAATVQPGESRTATDDVNDVEDGLADTFYAALLYDGGGMFTGGLAYADNETTSLFFDGPTAGIDILRATGLLNFGDFEVGALYQIAEGIDQAGGAVNGGDFEEASWLLSGAYKMGSWKLKAQYGTTDGDVSDITRTQMAIGADYKLSKAATAQLYYVTFEDEDRVVNGITDPSTDTFGVAFIYSF